MDHVTRNLPSHGSFHSSFNSRLLPRVSMSKVVPHFRHFLFLTTLCAISIMPVTQSQGASPAPAKLNDHCLMRCYSNSTAWTARSSIDCNNLIVNDPVAQKGCKEDCKLCPTMCNGTTEIFSCPALFEKTVKKPGSKLSFRDIHAIPFAVILCLVFLIFVIAVIMRFEKSCLKAKSQTQVTSKSASASPAQTGIMEDDTTRAENESKQSDAEQDKQ